MNQDLRGQRAIVTGGASGIGLACARAFAARGAHVVVADRDGDAATASAQEIGGEPWVVDLSDTAPLEDFRLIQRLRVEAPFLLIRAVLPGMYGRGRGRIVNISSVHGLRASPFKSAYVTAKHALEGLSKVTALEGAPHGVTSNCIDPGYVRTPLVEKQIADQARTHGIPASEVIEKVMLTEMAIKRLVEPHEVASLAGWLASGDAAMVTGASYTMDGGWSAR